MTPEEEERARDIANSYVDNSTLGSNAPGSALMNPWGANAAEPGADAPEDLIPGLSPTQQAYIDRTVPRSGVAPTTGYRAALAQLQAPHVDDGSDLMGSMHPSARVRGVTVDQPNVLQRGALAQLGTRAMQPQQQTPGPATQSPAPPPAVGAVPGGSPPPQEPGSTPDAQALAAADAQSAPVSQGGGMPDTPDAQPGAQPQPSTPQEAHAQVSRLLADLHAPPTRASERSQTISHAERERATEMQQDRLGVPAAVRGRAQNEADLANREQRLKVARLNDAVFHALGMLTMGVGQAFSGPRGLPDARLLAGMIPGNDKEQALQDDFAMEDKQHALDAQNADRTRLETRDEQRYQEGRSDRRGAQEFTGGQNDLNRRNALQAAGIRAMTAEDAILGRHDDVAAHETGATERARIAADARRATSRYGRGHGAGHAAAPATGPGSDQDIRELYAKELANSSNGAISYAQALQQTAGMPLHGPRSIDAARDRIHGQQAGAGTQTQRGDIRAEQQQNREEQQGAQRNQRYHQALETTGITEARASLDTVQRHLDSASDNDVRLAAAAMRGGPSVVAALPPAAQQLAQDLSQIQNVTLKNRSGAAVTDQEWDRFRAEAGTGQFISAAPIRYWIQRGSQLLNAREQNLRAGLGADETAPAPAAAGGAQPPHPGFVRVRRDSDGALGWRDPSRPMAGYTAVQQ